MKNVNIPKLDQIVIHPWVFAVFPVLSLYAKNLARGYLVEVLAIVASLLILSTLLQLLVNLLVRDRLKSGIIVSAFLVLFFSYGHIISAFSAALDRLHLSDKAQFLVKGESSLLFWLIVLGAVLAVIIFFVVKAPRDLRTFTKFLNVVALTLLLLAGANLGASGVKTFLMPTLRVKQDERAKQAASPQAASGTSEFQHKAFLPAIARMERVEPANLQEFIVSWQQNMETEGVLSGAGPDIYYIIVDAYARADILEEVYGFDNSTFLSPLEERGFYVADKSVSNYPQTALSLASSLNFTYLDKIVEQIGAYTNDRTPLELMISESKVSSFLRNNGYTSMAFETGYAPTDLTNADMYLSPSKWWKSSEFQEALIALTPLHLSPKTGSDFRRDRILYAFDHIADATQVEGPTFVFAHITAPHFPFIFDEEGNPIEPPSGVGSRSDYEYDEYLEGYTNQLIFVTKRLEATLDQILAQSPDPPIIIVQADHGPAAELDSSWSVEESFVPERMSILNVYYFPDRDYEALYESITPVNTFRVIFNEFFGTDYELLEDRSFFSSWSSPYLFTDITEEVSAGN